MQCLRVVKILELLKIELFIAPKLKFHLLVTGEQLGTNCLKSHMQILLRAQFIKHVVKILCIVS